MYCVKKKTFYSHPTCFAQTMRCRCYIVHPTCLLETEPVKSAQSALPVPTMALLLFCCEIKKKLRFLLYTTFILTVFNAAATALFVHLILGASFSLLVLLNFVVICYCEAGIVKYRLKDLKIALIFAVVLCLLHILSSLLLFIFASQGKI